VPTVTESYQWNLFPSRIVQPGESFEFRETGLSSRIASEGKVYLVSFEFESIACGHWVMPMP
jgi:hypothetical protein